MKLNRRGFLKLFGLTAAAHAIPLKALELTVPEIVPTMAVMEPISASMLEEFWDSAACDNFFVTTAFQRHLRSIGKLDPFSK